MSDRAVLTRGLLQRTALTLFTDRGYDATTVNDIAAAAGVSHMTFFRHFPTKEAVLMDDPYDPVLAEAVLAQPADLPALERVRRGLLAAWAALPEPAGEETRLRISLVAGHPGLQAAAWTNNQRTEKVVVDALTGAGCDRLEARVATGACLGALLAALFEWGSDCSDESLGSRIRRALAVLAPSGSADSRSATGRPSTGSEL